MRIAMRHSACKGNATLGNEDYAMSAIERLLEQEERPANIEAWLKLVINNMYIDRLRKVKRRGGVSIRDLPDEAIEELMTRHAPPSLSSFVADRDFIRQALESLNEKDVQIVLLEAAGWSTSEIAQELGYASNKVVANRRKHITDFLTRLLGKEGEKLLEEK